MPYRKTRGSVTWHWCHKCSAWPVDNFGQREDKPPTWNGQSLCEECATSDSCGKCQHSVELRAGLISDCALEVVPVTPVSRALFEV
jgi:hypothetical protein